MSGGKKEHHGKNPRERTSRRHQRPARRWPPVRLRPHLGRVLRYRLPVRGQPVAVLPQPPRSLRPTVDSARAEAHDRHGLPPRLPPVGHRTLIPARPQETSGPPQCAERTTWPLPQGESPLVRTRPSAGSAAASVMPLRACPVRRTCCTTGSVGTSRTPETHGR